jgi:hypothetical protein
MDIAATAMLGVADPLGQPILAAGALRGPASLIRAQVNTRATSLGADGLSWQEHLADTPRFSGPAERLLVEAQRTNAVRNARGEGAMAGTLGSGGTLPTNWTQSRSPELTLTVLGPATVNGLPGVRLRVSGTTAAGGGFAMIDFESPTASAALPSQSFAGSVFWRLSAGSTAGLTLARLQVTGRSATGAEVPGNAFSGPGAVLAATLSRPVVTATLTADATLARVNHRAAWTFAGGTAVDMTVDLCAPQLETGAFASTPILPPAGAPTATARGGDLITAPLASLGLGGAGACTILMSCLLPQGTPAVPGAFGFFSIDNGTANTRFGVRTDTSNGILGERLLAGAAAVSPASFTYTPGTPIRLGAAIIGDGSMRLLVAGGTIQGVTGGASGGLTTLRVGVNALGGAALSGETSAFRVLPFALPDAALPGAVAALPGG